MQLKLCGCKDKGARGFTGLAITVIFIGVVCDIMPHEV
jgi:hypothetical protein